MEESYSDPYANALELISAYTYLLLSTLERHEHMQLPNRRSSTCIVTLSQIRWYHMTKSLSLSLNLDPSNSSHLLQSMSEYWVSKKKYFCKYCDIYIADDVPSRQHHESGLRHKGNVERFIRGIYKAGEKKKKDQEEERREMVRVEQV